MSGGSFDYLYAAMDRGMDLSHMFEQMKHMAMALREYGPKGDVAANDTELVLKKFDEALKSLEHMGHVWKAVEWNHSGDIRKDAVLDALDMYVPLSGKEEELAQLKTAALHLNGIIQRTLLESK